MLKFLKIAVAVEDVTIDAAVAVEDVMITVAAEDVMIDAVAVVLEAEVKDVAVEILTLNQDVLEVTQAQAQTDQDDQILVLTQVLVLQDQDVLEDKKTQNLDT